MTSLLVLWPLIPSEAAVLGGFAPLQMLWLAALTVWSLQFLLGQQRRVVWDASLMLLTLVAGWVMLSALLCDGNRRQAWNIAWQWVSYAAAYFLLRQYLTTGRRARALMATLLALAVSLAVFALYQYFFSQPLRQEAYRRNPEQMQAEMGVFDPPGSPRWQHAENRILSKEPLATFSLTNSLAGFLAPWLMVAVGLGLSAAWAAPQTFATAVSPRKRAGFWAGLLGAAAVLTLVLLLTKSRSGVLALGAGLLGLGLAVWARRRGGAGQSLGRWLPLAGAGVALVLVLLAVLAVQVRGLDWEVLSEAPKSVLYRIEYWRASAALIADHPWFGAGPGNFKERYAAYQLPQASETIADPHNFLFELAANAGWPALAGLVACLAGAARRWISAAAAGDELPAQEPNAGTGFAPSPPAAALERSERRLLGALYAGALGGLLLALPIGLAVELEPEYAFGLPAVWLCGLLAGLPCLWLLQPWVMHGGDPRPLAALAAVVLLVNLLAAGALAFAGVMVTLWVALAIVASPQDSATADAGAGAQPWAGPGRDHAFAPPWQGAAAVVVSLTLAACCYATSFRPVMQAQTLTLDARSQLRLGNLAQAEALFARVAELDRLSPAGVETLAQLRLARFVELRSDQARADFSAAADEYLRRNPHHFVTHHQRGRWFLLEWRASTADTAPAALARAVAAFERASQAFPNSAAGHAQLALVYEQAGRLADARREADTAARLDALNPHADRKLAAEHLFLPEPLPPPNEPRATTPQTSAADNRSPPARETAEQIVARLRKLSAEAQP